MNEAASCPAHPTERAIGACERCGTFLCRQCSPDLELTCPACRGRAVERVPTPWEQRVELGLVQGLWRTWRLSLRSPNLFFRSVKPDGSVRDAFLYGWAVALVAWPGNVLNNMLSWWLNSAQMQHTFSQLGRGQSSPPLQLMNDLAHIRPWAYGLVVGSLQVVAYPLFFAMAVGLVHLGCVMFGARKHGIGATARVIGYSQGAAALVLIPILGGVLVLYAIVLEVVGLARVQETTEARAIGAVIVGPAILGCCGGGLVVVVVSMSVAASLGH